MPFFRSLKHDAGVSDLYRARPNIFRPWIHMGQEVMTKEAPLTQGERELIATYVSSLNNCAYCRAAHLPSMKAHGIHQDVVDALLADIDGAPVSEKMKPLFAYVRKLTLAPADLTQADADAVFGAGWNEEALHAAVMVVCRFSFMNRLVMAHGLVPPDASTAGEMAERRLREGYAGMHRSLEHQPNEPADEAAE